MRRLAYLLALIPCLALGIRGQAGPYLVELESDPPVLPVGKATLDAFITGPGGKPVEGATVRAVAQMPNMPMGEREQSATPSGEPGHYRFTQSFSMAGPYDARIVVSGPSGTGTATIPLETGKTTLSATQEGTSVLSLWPWLLGVGLLAFVLYRMRRTGQRVDARAVLNRRALGPALVLGGVSAVAIYAVNHLRRPGAMTPIEAQTMQMDMPPPEGVLPVTLATVEIRPLSAAVRYSGQALGFVEQEVNARTSGVIVWMPAYVGTTVKRGQVIARLDTSQLAPQVAQNQAMVESALQGVGVAEADYRQALAMVEQAQAEGGQLGGAAAEARANLAAARDDRESAAATVASAQADVKDAEARVDSAAADQRYWAEELKREATLFAAGAVSRDEYEREKAEAAKSEAGLRQAEEQVRGAQAKARAARAGSMRAASGVVAAQRKVDQARGAIAAQLARVRTARAGAATARRKIGQTAAGVRQAQAGLQGVAAQAEYAEIRSQIDGMVTQRSISPGTLVAPGQTILRVAQIEPIRLQANVPASDLARVRVGATVLVRHSEGDQRPVAATVTSVSPALDPVSRTGIVEATLPNRDRAYLPGQFVSLDISVGAQGSKLVVPAGAIQTSVAEGASVQASRSSSFVWLAAPVPGQPGRYTVERRPVEVGDRAGDLIAVRSGLVVGARVVVSGGEGLSDGDSVTAPAAHASKAAALTVSITEDGFEPATLTLPAGGTRRITFVRKTNATCAKEVVFPSLGIRRELPLNKAVTIDLPPGSPRTLGYACGMDMLKGKVIVQ